MRNVTLGQNIDIPGSGVGKLRPLSQIWPAVCFNKCSFIRIQVCLFIKTLYVVAFSLQRKTCLITFVIHQKDGFNSIRKYFSTYFRGFCYVKIKKLIYDGFLRGRV